MYREGRPVAPCRSARLMLSGEWPQAGRAVDLRQDLGRAAGSRQISVWAEHTYAAAFNAGIQNQNESISQLKSQTAGARGGAREGRPRHFRIFPVVSGG